MMTRMQKDLFTIIFKDSWKRDSLNVFQIIKFGFEIFEILQKYSCNTRIPSRIAFYHLFGVYQVCILK